LNANEKALSVYQKAYNRYNNGTSKIVDDVVVALWDEVQDMAETIREQNLRISMLEAKCCGKASAEESAAVAGYTRAMEGMSWYKKPQAAVAMAEAIKTSV
jgi:hypothetical protein